MSAASMATSVPVPMAMPTSAWARAGASLMPSPTMATSFALVLEASHLGGLVLGQDLGQDPVDAHLAGDGLGGAAVVAGDHHDFQAQGVQRGDGLRRPSLTVSATATTPAGSAVDGDVDRGLALGGQAPPPPGPRGPASTPSASRKLRRPTSTARPPMRARIPWPVMESNSAGSSRATTPRLGTPHDGLGQRVLRGPFGGGHQAQQILLPEPLGRHHVGEGGRALGDGAGLVEDDGLELVRRLQGFGRADEDAALGSLAAGHHDGQRGGQAEGARAGDDQHRHRGDQREGQSRRRPAGRTRGRTWRWR